MLLVRGAKRNISDCYGRRPIDIAHSITNSKLRNAIMTLLVSYYNLLLNLGGAKFVSKIHDLASYS